MLMDHQDIRTLKLLEELEKENSPSQRVLAKKMGVSLGLVNSFIKRLAAKGYFKATHIPKNRIRYILTPKGAAEKTRLTYQYIQYSYQYYRESRRKLSQMFRKLAGTGAQSVVFCGVSDLTEIAFLSLQETNIHLTAIVDENRMGESFLGYRVLGIGDLADLTFDKILITVLQNSEEIEKKIIQTGHGKAIEKIWQRGKNR